ncbi:MAG: alanine--tRNA ligase-related protein [archaeon]
MTSDKKSLRKQFSKDWQKHYALQIFSSRGFVRKRCSRCKTFFWTLDRARRKCGNSTCEPYSFIGKAIAKTDYVDTWHRFAKFFEKNGRTIIPRYPTIARWRDDTWFTQASIYCFQPHVVSGEVKPPANPLVIAQPCFRFNDIENIGLTSRHNGGFVMLGQHNFIPEAAHVEHWKDEDIGLVIDCLKSFGLKEKGLTFAEDVWMGGGNAGPSFEVFYGGMEILTTVFMQYAIVKDRLEELPLKVVDFGWGLERLAWLLNGTPTSYEITFDPVDKFFARKVKFTPDSGFLKKFSRYNANLDFDDPDVDVDSALASIAKKMKMKLPALKERLAQIQAFYSILDHARTLLFALADGALPSNSGGGYNLRFILRRALRMAERYNWQADLKELVREFARAFSGGRGRHVTGLGKDGDEELMESGLQPMYPELEERLPDVEKILDVEIRKYNETKQKISAVLGELFKKKRSITEPELISFYDSQGIMPEDVVAAAEKANVRVKLPDNFYSKVASLHTEKKSESVKTTINVAGIGATQLLYYADEYAREFSAKVLKIIDGKYVVLDKTLFYPQSGGQFSDTGTINNKPVLNVSKIGNTVVHDVENPNFREGQFVIGKIDWKRRYQLMRHHTATHIINGAIRSVLGNHVWQAGAEKTPEKARLDFTHFSNLTPEEMQLIERRANEAVLANIPVKKTIMPKDAAEKKYGFRLYQGGAVPGASIRVIETEGLDVEACGGTHLNNTGEAGFIKVTGSKKIQDGVVRIEFVAGLRALDEMQSHQKLLTDSATVFNVPADQLPKTCARFFDEWKSQRKEIEKYKQQSQPQKPQVKQEQKNKK